MIPEYEDEVAATRAIHMALIRLADQDAMWESNFSIYSRMDVRRRILWWRAAKKQAQLGAPAMQTLLLKVIELRLTE